jgi:hypothetical protein
MGQFEKQVLSLLTPKGLVARTFFGGVELYAQTAPSIARAQISLEESIYRGTPLERAVLVSAGKIFKIGDIFPSIRLNGHIVGTDKLSHFFETGYELFDEHLRTSGEDQAPDARPLQTLIDHAIDLEDGHLGLGVTGIKSYADIAAHLQGALFWRELTNENGPWLQCESGRLQVVKDFDFRDFVHDGWSEAINCNGYAEGKETASIFDLFRGPPPPYKDTVRQNEILLREKTGQSYHCPIDPSGCERAKNFLTKLLPAAADRLRDILSPDCTDINTP